jgi:membrane-associated phospholipid phosphatase
VVDLPSLPTIGLRLAIIAGCLIAWFATQRLIGRRPADAGRIGDALHRLTARANAWLHRHPRATDGLLVASSLWIDAVTLFVLAHAVIGPDFAPFLGLLCVFALRQICQAIVSLPAPPGIPWRDPGFPSLFVTYAVGNDFFFSGHTALAVYGAFLLAALGIPALTAFGAAMAIAEIVLVIVLRAHWTLDVIAGLLAAVGVALLFGNGPA